MFSCTDFLFLFYLIFYHFISVAHSPFLRLLHSQQSEPCKEPFALFQKLLSRAIRKDEERKHDLFSSCDLKAPPPPFMDISLFSGKGEGAVCVRVLWEEGGILIIVHAWVINQFRRYWKTVDGRCCSEGKKSKRGKYEGGVFWFVPVGSQDFFKKMMLFFFFFF